ncbi:hypothetical protein ACGFSB_22000 [Streptomyces sp. NPDC048441]|uniref:hypothetical protein n=1 Tax=Streptomyces sp. NPDC048441 TaxID=3365552 RepID=UPI0037234F75
MLEQLAGLVGGPGGSGVGGDAQDVYGTGAYLHDEEDVQPLQRDGVHVEEISGEQPARLGLEERGPLSARRVPARCGAEATSDAVDVSDTELARRIIEGE